MKNWIKKIYYVIRLLILEVIIGRIRVFSVRVYMSLFMDNILVIVLFIIFDFYNYYGINL